MAKKKNNKLWWIAPIVGIGAASYVFYEKFLKINLFSTESKKPTFIDEIFDCEKRTPSVIKSHSTRVINNYLKNANWFEIGKTGQYEQRVDFYKEGKVVLLAKSKFRDKIIELETFYAEKYKDNPKNTNKTDDSSVRMETNDGFFYLYIVVG